MDPQSLGVSGMVWEGIELAPSFLSHNDATLLAASAHPAHMITTPLSTPSPASSIQNDWPHVSSVASSLLQVQPTPHLGEVHHGCGGKDGCSHCEPQHHHREVSGPLYGLVLSHMVAISHTWLLATGNVAIQIEMCLL